MEYLNVTNTALLLLPCSANAVCVNKPQDRLSVYENPGYYGDDIDFDSKSAPPFRDWFIFSCSNNYFSQSRLI